MLKRVLYLSLWFYAGWTLGSFITYAFGVTGVMVLPEFVAPATGVAVAAAVAYDLRRVALRGLRGAAAGTAAAQGAGESI